MPMFFAIFIKLRALKDDQMVVKKKGGDWRSLIYRKDLSVFASVLIQNREENLNKYSLVGESAFASFH